MSMLPTQLVVDDEVRSLATVVIPLPPLRDRKVDIPALADSLLASAMKSLGKKVKGFTDEALAYTVH